MYWSSGIVRIALIAVVMAAGLAAQKAQRAPKLEKPRKHGIGIVYAIPKDWKVEDGAEAVGVGNVGHDDFEMGVGRQVAQFALQEKLCGFGAVEEQQLCGRQL